MNKVTLGPFLMRSPTLGVQLITPRSPLQLELERTIRLLDPVRLVRVPLVPACLLSPSLIPGLSLRTRSRVVPLNVNASPLRGPSPRYVHVSGDLTNPPKLARLTVGRVKHLPLGTLITSGNPILATSLLYLALQRRYHLGNVILRSFA